MVNRILVVLVSLTVVMQGIILFRQYAGPRTAAPRPPVRDAPPNTIIDLTGLPTQGKQNANLVLVEFSDYECPFCARHATGVGRQVEKEFVATGRVRMAFSNLPLQIHPNAKSLAIAAICAGHQDQYWEMRDLLFSKQPKTADDVRSILGLPGLSLDANRFQACLKSEQDSGKQISKDLERAEQLHLAITPTFAIGRATSAGKIHVEKIITGAQPFGVFQNTLNVMLSVEK